MSSNIRQGTTGSRPENEGVEKDALKEDVNFDYGSDDELPEESIENRLSWRTEDSFSDWKIDITVTKSDANNDTVEGKSMSESGSDIEEKKVVTYHVHRSVLAFGPRRSDYFVTLFQQQEGGPFTELQEKTSHIDLNEMQADAFPELLDYMYSTGAKVSFTTETATTLYSLSKYFGVKRLQNEAKKFCLEDMRHCDRCGTYYEHAKILQQDTILEPATKFCRDNIVRINSDTSRLHHVPDPQFWLDLMQHYAEKNSIPNYLTTHIASFSRNHATTLSLETFRQLTDEKYLPENKISPGNAMLLLHAERNIFENDNNDNDHGVDEDKLSSLQTRCVNVIVGSKKEDFRPLKNYKEWTYNLLKSLSPLVLSEIIARGLILES